MHIICSTVHTHNFKKINLIQKWNVETVNLSKNANIDVPLKLYYLCTIHTQYILNRVLII